MKFLRICEWGKYQHYKDRNPPWIKLHVELMNSYTWVTVDDASRLLALVLMMLAARTGNRIPLDRDFIQRSAYLRRRPDVRPLVECGFAEIFEEDEADIENKPLTEVASDLQADASEVLAVDTECLTRDRDRDREEKEKAYVRPTLAEVSNYCRERQNRIDAHKWFDYYTANGWRVGRNPMKDWRAAVRTWEKNGYGGPFDDGHKTAAQRRNERSTANLERAFAEVEATDNLPSAVRKGVI